MDSVKNTLLLSAHLENPDDFLQCLCSNDLQVLPAGSDWLDPYKIPTGITSVRQGSVFGVRSSAHAFSILSISLKSEKEDALQELVRSLNGSQQSELWHGLSGHIITATINEAALELTVTDTGHQTGNVHQHKKSSLDLLKAVLKLAKLTISIKDCIVPQSLYQSALLLHGYVLSSNHNELKAPVAELCEIWWLNGIEGSTSLTLAPLIYLLEKCLHKKPTHTAVRRLWKIREMLDGIAEGDGDIVWDLILNLFTHNSFLRLNESHKFVSYILMTHPCLLKKIHGIMKYNLANSSLVIADIYASVTLSAWEKCAVETTKAIIDTELIQDIMYNAVHIKRNGNKSLHSQLMQYMSKLHSWRGRNDVNTMLTRLYKPFLWRSLRAANSDVRANASQLFFGCFPLVDVTQSQEQCENTLQKHFDFIFELLEDEDHIVRQVSVTGVCQVLSAYCVQIPAEVSSDLLDLLFSKLAWDQNSADVRVAVIQGITSLLDDHNNYAVLSALIPTLADLFHDKVERVRFAFVNLLLKMKHIRAFKIWKVISKTQLFARLEVDSSAICVKLVELTYKSFIDDDLDNNVKLERCVELIDSGLDRTRRFYRYAVVQITMQQAVNYVLLLRKCILTCVNQYKAKGKENRRPSLCTTLANLTMANRTIAPLADTTSAIGSNFTMIDNQLTQFSMKDFDGSQEEEEEELTVENIPVMKGLLDIICILWAGFKKELNMAGNDELNGILCDKFSRALVEFFPVFQDEDIHQSLVYLASFLPIEKSSALRKSTEKRFRELPSTFTSNRAVNVAECSNLVLCLCQWGLCNKVVDLLQTWSTPLTAVNRARRSKDAENTEASLRSLTCVMNCLLNLSSSIDMMETQDCLGGLEQVCNKLYNVQAICTKSLSSAKSLGWDIDLLISLLFVHSKLEHILYKTDDKRLTNHIKDMCFIVGNCCTKHLSSTDDQETAEHVSEVKKPRRLLDLEITVLQTSVNESTLSLDADGTGYSRKLAGRVAHAILIILVNHVMVAQLNPETTNFLCNMFKISDSLCAAGAEISNVLTELLIQLSKSMLKASHTDRDGSENCIQDCWSRLISARIRNIFDVDYMTGKSKSSWISLLQSTDVLSDRILEALGKVMATSMLSLLGDVDITPTLSAFLGVSMKTSSLLHHFITEELRERDSSSAEHDSPNENIQLLIKLAEKEAVVENA